MKVEKRLAVQAKRRQFRVRNRVIRDAHGRPRLSVFRSNRHMYAQIIDDAAGKTLASASTVEAEVAGAGKCAGNIEFARKVGELIGKRATELGISKVVFDRGSFRYHGRVAAVADAARAAGLEF
ncbi:MAG: 50S ribosomal protein L18 [Planctomycetaceae bacterium]|nr:50S ribosomal protein L18 [Planctomycetaceae bacterium]